MTCSKWLLSWKSLTVVTLCPAGFSDSTRRYLSNTCISIANRRCAQLGLEPAFATVDNPFPWMSEAMDLKKEKNFFETRVIEYQNGGALAWD